MRQTGPDGKPIVSESGATEIMLAFYRDDHVLLLDDDGKPAGMRADFIRDQAGQVRWFRSGGRLNRKGGNERAKHR